MGMDEVFFFGGQPDALQLYELFRERVMTGAHDVQIRVQKTQISFSNRHVFTCVSRLPVRKKKDMPKVYIVITFGLSHPLNSPRIDAKTEPYPNRWTHHVVVSTPEEIDEELLSWVREAYWFALEK